MKKPRILLTFALPALLVFCSHSLRADSPKSPEGIWLGSLDYMGAKFRIVFRISKTAEGGWKSLMDSPDQGAKDIPVSETTVRGDSVILRVALAAGLYEGKLNPDGKTIEGVWKQSGMTLPLVLSVSESAPQSVRPQDPKPPFPYVSEEVVIPNAAAGINLSGTLTRPEGKGPYTAVILISGSGPQDRDEMVFGHRPFLVLSDFLTRKGIAVLRYDDRGVGKSTGSRGTATTVDFASDAGAAVEFLRERPDIHPKRIGLAGHSEGGIIAPMIASQRKDVAFIVMLAGPGLRGDSIIVLQAKALMKADTTDDRMISRYIGMQRRLLAILEAEPDTAIAAMRIRALLNELTDEEKQKAGLNESAISIQVRQVNSPWFRFFIGYDPVSALENTRCPVLALWGEKDLQVPPVENLPAVESALKKAGNRRYTLLVLPGLNHLFQACTKGTPSE